MTRPAMLLAILADAAAAPASRKNVLFFVVDDLRVQLGVDRVPGTPAMSTPNLDRVIGKSLFLRRAQVQQALCSPTRASVLTSRYPDTTRVYDLYSWFRTVGGNYTTIPQLFKESGYRAVGAGKIFHPGHASGAGSGVPGASGDDTPYSWTDPYYHPPNNAYWSSKRAVAGCDGCGDSWVAVSPEAERAMPLPDSQTADYAVGALEGFSREGVGRPSARPFFLAVGFHKPHLPFVAPSRFFDLYPPDEIQLPGDQLAPTDMPAVAWSGYAEMRSFRDTEKLNNTGKPGDVLPSAVTKSLRRAYYAAVSFTDHNVGRVLDALEATGYGENTIVSFIGDHGWQLGEHGEWCKHTNFDLATSAPMWIRIPGVTDRGIVSSTPTELLDLMPTLAEAAMGVTVPACPPGAHASRQVQLCTQGTSLLPLIDNPTRPVKQSAYSQYTRGYQRERAVGLVEEEEDLDLVQLGRPRPSACLSKRCTMGYSVLTHHEGSEYRYTVWVDFNTKHRDAPDWERGVGSELYNHTEDPMENVNAAPAASRALLAELRRRVRAHPVWAAAPAAPRFEYVV